MSVGTPVYQVFAPDSLIIVDRGLPPAGILSVLANIVVFWLLWRGRRGATAALLGLLCRSCLHVFGAQIRKWRDAFLPASVWLADTWKCSLANYNNQLQLCSPTVEPR